MCIHVYTFWLFVFCLFGWFFNNIKKIIVYVETLDNWHFIKLNLESQTFVADDV